MKLQYEQSTLFYRASTPNGYAVIFYMEDGDFKGQWFLQFFTNGGTYLYTDYFPCLKQAQEFEFKEIFL